MTGSFAMPQSYAARKQVYELIRNVLAPGGVVLIKDFDTSMTGPPEFANFHMLALEELTEAFDGFEIERAEIVPTPVHTHADPDAAEQSWTAALFMARKLVDWAKPQLP